MENKFINGLKRFEDKRVIVTLEDSTEVEGIVMGIDYNTKDIILIQDESLVMITNPRKIVIFM